jgi:hypothetical protein
MIYHEPFAILLRPMGPLINAIHKAESQRNCSHGHHVISTRFLSPVNNFGWVELYFNMVFDLFWIQLSTQSLLVLLTLFFFTTVRNSYLNKSSIPLYICILGVRGSVVG